MPYSTLRFRLCLLTLLALTAFPLQAQTRSPDLFKPLVSALGLQGRVMWVDGSANIARTTTREGVKDLVERCKKANFNTIVVDVKPVVGQVLYDSVIAQRLTQWQGKSYPRFDVLGAFIEEGKAAGIDIAASLNVFSEGHKYFNAGLAYEKREWQSIAYTADRAIVAANGDRLTVRAASDPEDDTRPPVFGDTQSLAPAKTSAGSLIAFISENGSVDGIADPALLGEESVTAPEDGSALPVSGNDAKWAEANLVPGTKALFDTTVRRTPVTDSPTEKVAAFVNPLHAEARAYELSLLKEVATKYPISSLVFDRMRYANVFNDFSDLTRTAFEKWLGKSVARWPEEILFYPPTPGEKWQPGPLYRQWIEFRARVTRDFLREATEVLRGIRPELRFGAYVGSWYREYFPYGVNWASERFPVRLPWATPEYNEAGYAELLDWISTGCYYPAVSREDARNQNRDENLSVESAAELSVTVVQNAAPVYAGVYAMDYAGKPEEFARAVAMAAKKSHGVMVFDVSQIYAFDWWKILEQAFNEVAEPPHRYPEITSQIRAVQSGIP